MASLDLKDAYFMVSVHATHRKFLRFNFQGRLYQFTTLPFGLNTAPFAFTKLLKPILSFLRQKGWLSVVYIDDFLLFGDNSEECSKNVRETLFLLSFLGFIINKKKSQLIPCQQCTFLGFFLDSKRMSIALPETKRLLLLARVRKFYRLFSCKIREFANLVGSLISARRTIPYGIIYSKFSNMQQIWLWRNQGAILMQLCIFLLSYIQISYGGKPF